MLDLTLAFSLVAYQKTLGSQPVSQSRISLLSKPTNTTAHFSINGLSLFTIGLEHLFSTTLSLITQIFLTILMQLSANFTIAFAQCPPTALCYRALPMSMSMRCSKKVAGVKSNLSATPRRRDGKPSR